MYAQLGRGGEHVGIVGQTGDARGRKEARPEPHAEQQHQDAEEQQGRHRAPLQAALDLGDGEFGDVGSGGFGHGAAIVGDWPAQFISRIPR